MHSQLTRALWHALNLHKMWLIPTMKIMYDILCSVYTCSMEKCLDCQLHGVSQKLRAHLHRVKCKSAKCMRPFTHFQVDYAWLSSSSWVPASSCAFPWLYTKLTIFPGPWSESSQPLYISIAGIEAYPMIPIMFAYPLSVFTSTLHVTLAKTVHRTLLMLNLLKMHITEQPVVLAIQQYSLWEKSLIFR